MNLKRKLSFIGYLLVIIAMFGAGLVYTISDRIQPYHLNAMESSWDLLTIGIRTMSLNFMKSAGAGFLSSGLGMLFILIYSFRKNEKWANYGLLSIGITQIGIIACRTYNVLINTKATPPLVPLIMIIIILIISFILGLNKDSKIKSS